MTMDGMWRRGECKMPGGKLVAVSLRRSENPSESPAEGADATVNGTAPHWSARIDGDFFVEGDADVARDLLNALETTIAAVVNTCTDAYIKDSDSLTSRLGAVIDEHPEATLVGATAGTIATAAIRALDGITAVAIRYAADDHGVAGAEARKNVRRSDGTNVMPTLSRKDAARQGNAAKLTGKTSDAANANANATANAGEFSIASGAAWREDPAGKSSASAESASNAAAAANAGERSAAETAAALFPNLTVVRDVPREPAMQLALDQACAEAMAAGRMGPLIRLWQWDRAAVVIGRFQSVGNEVNLDQARAEHVTVVRRITGGGAMFAEPESVITYSLIAPFDWVTGLSIEDSYRRCDQWVLDALRPLGIEARYQPINDIASPLGKIGGAAQRRFPAPADGTGHGGGPGAVLHHTMLSYDMDAAKMLRVLNVSKEKMSDKAVKSAAKRVDPLRSQTGLTRAEVLDRMIATLTDPEGPYRARHAGPERADAVIGRDVLDRAANLAWSRFSTPEWTAIIP